MAREQTCDICNKPAELAAKLYLGPRGRGKDFSSYTAHLDVGTCCLVRVQGFGKWQKRRKINREKKPVEEPQAA